MVQFPCTASVRVLQVSLASALTVKICFGNTGWMPEAATYRGLSSRQHSTGSTSGSASSSLAVQSSSSSGSNLGAGQRAAAGYTALAAGQGCGAVQGQDLLAGTANGRARWIDVEQGELKADMSCRIQVCATRMYAVASSHFLCSVKMLLC